jgi:CRISP-associated protein Cas1
LSAEVLFAALENDVDVQFVQRNGKPMGRLWGNRFGSISMIRKQQLVFSQHAAAVAWVQQVLGEKIDNQCATLLAVQSTKDAYVTETPIGKMREARQRLLDSKADTLVEAAPRLRSLEAAASKHYFQTLSQLLPPQYRFGARSQHPALDMFNSLLNYAYGILYGKVETAMIRAGIDPFVGIFHRDEYNRPVLVYDVIERFRCWADITVIRLCQQEVIFSEFFEVENGAYFLNSYGKRILIQAFTDYLEEVVLYQKMERSRNTHIDVAMQQLATFFKEFI